MCGGWPYSVGVFFFLKKKWVAFLGTLHWQTAGEEVVFAQVSLSAGIDAVADIGSGGFWKRVRLSRKTPAHLVYQDGLGGQSCSRVWKRVRFGYHRSCVDGEGKRSACSSMIRYPTCP